MGTTGLLATAAGFFGGMFLTAVTLWFNERKSRRALEQITDRLRENDARVHSLLREARDIIAIVGPDGTITYLSPAADRALGRSSARLVGTNPLSWVHPEDRERLSALLAARVGSDGDPGQTEFRVPHESGHWVMLEAVATNMRDDPAVEGIVLTCRDVTERKRHEAELREAQERFRSAFDYAPIGMALASLDGRYFRVNRALAHMLGRAEDELAGASMVTLTHPGDRKSAQEAMRRLIDGEVPGYRMEQRFVHSDGRPVWVSVSVSLVRDAENKPLYSVSQLEDITERRASGERLAHQAIHDPLTGLPNRTFFVDRLRRALNDHDAAGQVAVLFIDLDHFKVVNDSLGHPAGDRLIVAIADRLRTAIRPSDIVARFGGDEFTVLCTGVPDEATASELADRISVAVAKPVALAEGECFVTASIGIALSGGELETPETLLRNADAAMYKAKDQGRARSAAYESGAHDRAVKHLRTGNDLHRALERGELVLHYQPIVRLDTGKISGFEALLRWQHPQRGLVGPGEFVELAEETGLVVPIGMWAFGEACRQAVFWHQKGSMVTMSVNLSPRQLAEPDLTDEIARVLEDTGVNPDAIWLEITENTLMADAEAAARALHALRELGVHLSVDDFGTGYSSMSYLKRFPVEALKVDRTFVDGIGREPEDTAICTAVVSLAQALGVRCIAEGVETPEQFAELHSLGCDLGQGYLFGRAEPPEMHGDRPDLRVLATTPELALAAGADVDADIDADRDEVVGEPEQIVDDAFEESPAEVTAALVDASDHEMVFTSEAFEHEAFDELVDDTEHELVFDQAAAAEPEHLLFDQFADDAERDFFETLAGKPAYEDIESAHDDIEEAHDEPEEVAEPPQRRPAQPARSASAPRLVFDPDRLPMVSEEPFEPVRQARPERSDRRTAADERALPPRRTARPERPAPPEEQRPRRRESAPSRRTPPPDRPVERDRVAISAEAAGDETPNTNGRNGRNGHRGNGAAAEPPPEAAPRTRAKIDSSALFLAPDAPPAPGNEGEGALDQRSTSRNGTRAQRRAAAIEGRRRKPREPLDD